MNRYTVTIKPADFPESEIRIVMANIVAPTFEFAAENCLLMLRIPGLWKVDFVYPLSQEE